LAERGTVLLLRSRIKEKKEEMEVDHQEQKEEIQEPPSFKGSGCARFARKLDPQSESQGGNAGQRGSNKTKKTTKDKH